MSTAWHLESWRKAYVTKSASWLSMPLSARSLGRELLTYVDDLGRIKVRGGDVAGTIIQVCSAHLNEHKRVREDVRELLEDGYLVAEDGFVRIRNYVEAQDRTPGAKRTAEWRRRKTEESMAPRDVTRTSHVTSQGDARETSPGDENVGPTRSDPIRPDPRSLSEPLVPLLPAEAPAPSPASTRVESPETSKIREALAAHPETARFAVGNYAPKLEGRRMASGTAMELVTAAIADAADEALEGELPNVTWNRVRIFCDHAKERAQRRKAKANGPAPNYVNNRVQHDPPGRQAWKAAQPLSAEPDPNFKAEDL